MRAKRSKNEDEEERQRQRLVEGSKTYNTVLKGLQDKQRERDDKKLQSDKDHVLVFDSPVTGEQNKGWCH